MSALPLQALHSPFPADRYLLPTAKRFRYRALDGRLDAEAVKSGLRLLPYAPDLTVARKARLQRVLRRIEKAVIAFGALGDAGQLDDAFGFPIVIEVPEGQARSGVSAEGVPWSSTMTGASYGFLPGTLAEDAEEVDVYRGPDHTAPMVFVVTQLGDAERKLMLGFPCAADALRCYFANVPPQFFGEMHAFPVELLRELLGYEGEEGMLQKALLAGTATAGAAVLVTKTAGALVAPMTLVDVPRPGSPLDAIKGVTDVGSFAGGGVILPGQGAPRTRRPKVRDAAEAAVLPIQYAAAGRLEKAFASARACKALPVGLAERPELAQQPAILAVQHEPLTGTYDNPAEVGGWLGWIEPDDESWIAFVDVIGKVLLWTEREPDGGVIGAPILLDRLDLARGLFPGGVEQARAELNRKAVRLLPVAKDLFSAPAGKRIVYGVVLEPEPFGGAGDAHDETYSADEIETAAHAYLASFGNLNDSHGRFITSDRAVIVESFIAPTDFTVGGSTIRKGAWVLAAKIFDPELWARILSGELGAWSIEGYAERTPNLGPPPAAAA